MSLFSKRGKSSQNHETAAEKLAREDRETLLFSLAAAHAEYQSLQDDRRAKFQVLADLQDNDEDRKRVLETMKELGLK